MAAAFERDILIPIDKFLGFSNDEGCRGEVCCSPDKEKRKIITEVRSKAIIWIEYKYI